MQRQSILLMVCACERVGGHVSVSEADGARPAHELGVLRLVPCLLAASEIEVRNDGTIRVVLGTSFTRGNTIRPHVHI
jgi:hypothetical protein